MTAPTARMCSDCERKVHGALRRGMCDTCYRRNRYRSLPISNRGVRDALYRKRHREEIRARDRALYATRAAARGEVVACARCGILHKAADRRTCTLCLAEFRGAPTALPCVEYIEGAIMMFQEARAYRRPSRAIAA